MEVKKADIRYFSLGGLSGNYLDNVRHIKVLPCLSVVQSVEGNYDIQVGTQKQQHTENGGFFIAPSGMKQTIVHHVHPETGVMKARWLFLDVVLNETAEPDFFYDFPVILPQTHRGELSAVFDLLFSSTDIFAQYACCYSVLKILFSLAQQKVGTANDAMVSAFAYIRRNYMEKITVEDMANYLHMSPSNLHAAFKKHFGTSPIAYINKFRISLAAEQLRQTDDSISSISASVGISDPFYFNKLFHKEYRMSPKEYRNKRSE